MQFKKERITVAIVQTALVCLVMSIPGVVPMLATALYVNLALLSIILFSIFIAYFYSYKALLHTTSTKKSLWIGYLSMLLVWLYVTFCFCVVTIIAAHYDCRQLYSAHAAYKDCVGSVGQNIGVTLLMSFVSLLYALPLCLIGSIISYLTKYAYNKFNKQ
jgi:hypothetical protein